MTDRQPGLLPDWLDAAARSSPERLALMFGDSRWSFAELRRAVDGAASVLAAAHGARGGRIGILSSNRPGFVFAVHAARRLGASIVPFNWRQTSEELAWQLRLASVSNLVVDEQRVPVAEVAAVDLDVGIVPISALEEPIEEPVSRPWPESIDLDAEAVVLFTSGTSGRPKGARLTYGNLWYSAIGSALHLGHHHEDVWLAMLPLFHTGGLSILVRGVISATPVVLHERFDPEQALAALDGGATLVSAVPATLRQMLEYRGSPWPASLRCLLLGGSAAPTELVEECLRLGIPVAPTYGLTETASQVTTLLPTEVADRPGSSGRPLPTTEVRIVGQDGLAAPGETGEIEVRGLTLFAGYVRGLDSKGRLARFDVLPAPPYSSLPSGWERKIESPSPVAEGEGLGVRAGGADADMRTLKPDELPEGLSSDGGWFPTGDAGYLDDEGYLYVVDRRDDLIVSGGENVYPAEIERVLLEHPGVRDAAVVGLPDATWGARPVAIVVRVGDTTAAPSELLTHCRRRLASYKIPERILVRRELPRSPSGKLLRRLLREALLDEEAASTELGPRTAPGPS
jgi:O-succinylbenzoic acid--CoA ligase